MMKKIMCAVLLSLVSPFVMSASIADKLEVDHVRVDRSGLGYVTFKAPLVGTPATQCRTTFTQTLAFDTNTPGGSAILSVALAAQASKKKIYAVGTGDCALYGVMEDWDWGYIQ